MNDMIPSGNSSFARLWDKLDAIERKQDEQAEAFHQANLSMVRMEERQVTIHERLTSDAGRITSHDSRIESLEKSRDKMNTIVGMIITAWTSLVGVAAWVWANLPLTKFGK